MAMAFHEITKIQARKKTVPDGRRVWRSGSPRCCDQWKVLGLKTGRMISSVRGTMDVTPRTVANVAPEADPEVAGDEEPDQADEGDDEHAHGDGRARGCRAGEKVRPSGTWKSTAMYPAASSMLIGATGNQPSQ